MKKKFLLETIFCLLLSASSLGQCPDRDSLWERLVYLRDFSANAPLPAEQIKELLRYEMLMKDCPYQSDSTHALLLQRIAALYYLQGDYVNAIKNIKKSIGIVNDNRSKPTVNLGHQVRSYYILSLCYGELKKMTEKMNAIDSCVSLSVKLNSIDVFALYVLGERVEYLFDAGDYKRAYEFAVLGETVAKQLADGEGSEYIDFFSGWIVNTLIASKNFNSAGKILADKIEVCKRTKKIKNLSTFYEQLAQVQFETGNIGMSKNTFQEAYQYELKMGEPLKCSQILTNLGYYIYFKHFMNLNEAIKIYRRALQHLRTIKSPDANEIFESLNIYGNIANAFTHQGKYDSAFTNFQKAFDQIRPGITEREILQTTWIDSSYKKIRYLVSLMIEKGEAYARHFKETREPKDIQEAIRLYKLTDQILDKIKEGHSEIQSKLFWRNDTRHLYEYAIEACYLAGKPEESFYFFEKSRAVLLNDQLNEQRLLKEEDMLKLAQANRKILDLEEEYNNTEETSDRYAEIAKERFTSKQELDRIVNTIKINNPLYYQSFFDSASITIQDVRKNLLQDHQALVELFAGDSSIYTLILTAKNIHLKKVSKTNFESLVNRYINYVSDPSLQNRNFNEFVDASSKLYQLLFQDEPLPKGRIVISPDGRYFPFESLVTSKLPITYFLSDYAVSYTYSARYLTNNFVGSSGSYPKNFIGIAPVQYPSGMHLASLPGSDRSIQNLQVYFSNSDKLIASAATRHNFLREYYKYGIIQLYTHSSDSSVQGEPVIYFADSALYLSDLINEHKPLARLIVLSACETGAGTVYNGEGVFSFNRGFAALGIPAAITNLWSVDNESTYMLTELFYKWLSKGLPTDVALQKAKLEFLQTVSKEKSLPFYWAAPVLVGKTEIIELSKSYPWTWIAIFAAIGLIAFWIMRRRFVPKQRPKEKRILT